MTRPRNPPGEDRHRQRKWQERISRYMRAGNLVLSRPGVSTPAGIGQHILFTLPLPENPFLVKGDSLSLVAAGSLVGVSAFIKTITMRIGATIASSVGMNGVTDFSTPGVFAFEYEFFISYVEPLSPTLMIIQNLGRLTSESPQIAIREGVTTISSVFPQNLYFTATIADVTDAVVLDYIKIDFSIGGLN